MVSFNTWRSLIDGSEYGGIPDSAITRLEFEQDLTDSWDGNDGSGESNISYSTDAAVGSYAANFGSSGGINLGTPSNLEFGAGDEFSVSVWANPDSTGGLVMARDGGPPFIVFRNDGGTCDAEINDNSVAAKASTSLSETTYTHLAFTYGSGNLTLYKNGSQVGSDSASLGGGFVQYDWVVGGNANLSEYSGLLDDPRWYDKELSASEVSNLYSTDSIGG